VACEESRKSFHGANWVLADVDVISFAFFMLSPFILYLHKMERKSSKEYSVVFVVEGEKFNENCPRGSSLFSSWRKDCPVLKHSRVSEVFKGFNVHDFEHYGQRNNDLKWEFSLCH